MEDDEKESEIQTLVSKYQTNQNSKLMRQKASEARRLRIEDSGMSQPRGFHS